MLMMLAVDAHDAAGGRSTGVALGQLMLIMMLAEGVRQASPEGS